MIMKRESNLMWSDYLGREHVGVKREKHRLDGAYDWTVGGGVQ